MNSRPRNTIFVLSVLFLAAFSPALVAADGETPIVEIHAHWMDANESSHDHAWKFTFTSPAENYLHTATMNLVQQVSSGSVILDVTVNASELENVSEDPNSLIWRPDSQLTFDDQITIKVFDSDTLVTSREVGVTVWNQPLADHEVTIATNWLIDQEYVDEFGIQSYQLEFVGQGWQQRVGDTLVANELGNGSLHVTENTENGTMDMEILLASIWRNETTIDGVLDLQEFEATGTGNLYLSNGDNRSTMYVNATVNDALFNRTYAGGSHSQHIRLQALGDLNMTEDVDGDNGTWIDGELSLLLVETRDVDGVRVFSLTHIEATAEMHMIDGDQRFDLEVEQLVSVDRWLDGERTEENNKIIAHGTFGFADEEDNGSVTINGTVIDFRSESIDGLTVQDKLHVDGIIEGEASGTFGIVRDIKETGTWHNINETDYEVNVIHQESWFNITAVQGWSNGGDGVGGQHNETWFYTVPQTDWDNRTIYQRWRSSGISENDEGEEYPEDSPIEKPPEAPETEESLGEANISRETGLSPLSLSPGDQLILDSQEGMTLKVNATATSNVNKDGHDLPVTLWNGEYLGTESGIANGAIVNEGILDGLIAQIVRQTEVESPAGYPVSFNETQTLERVLSPSIVTAAENHDPSIVSVGLRAGLIVNEGGSVTHLEVEVNDVDWNVNSVTADLGTLGMGTLELNDLGLNGDSGVHDDIWTSDLTYMGILHGQISINITVTDAFSASVTQAANITIFNQAPRLTSFEFTPILVVRGDTIIVNAEVFDGNGVDKVAIDLRDEGGHLTDLTFDTFSQNWAGQVSIPSGMSPGNHNLRIMMTDSDGSSIIVTEMQTLGVHKSSGQDTRPDDVIPTLQVINEGPLFVSIDVDKSPIKRPNLGGEDITITATVSDPDGLSTVVIKLADLSPPGMQDTWLFMNDDGQNGDITANDGIWTYVFQSRSGMPLGTFAVTVRATDTYGAWNEDDSLAIQVVEDNGIDLGGDPSSVLSSSAVVMGLVGLLVIAAIGLVVVIIRRTKEEGGMKWDESDAFGGV